LIEMSNITYYLIESHGLDAMNLLVAGNIDSLSIKSGRYDLARKIMAQLNLKYINGYESGMDQSKYFNLSFNNEAAPLKVEGYAFYKSLNYYSGNSNFEHELKIDSSRIVVISFNETEHILACKLNKDAAIEFKMDLLIEKLFKKYSDNHYKVLPEDLTIYFENDKYKCSVLFSSISGTYFNDNSIERLNSLEMDVLYVGK
jgi:hypothetical protein